MAGISESDYEHWREHGYVIVRLLDDDQLAAALENIDEYMPSWEEYARHPRWFAETVGSKVHRRPGQGATFPYVNDALNASTIHPEYVAFAERVMGTKRIMLSHGQLGGKYAGTRDFEQQLHYDYGNNTLVVPKPDSEILDLPMILYYTDVTVDLSPTYAVSQQYTRDEPLTPRFRSREEYPEMYEREFPVTVPAGSALIYSMNTFHRGSALRAKEGLRFAQNIGLKRIDAQWTGQETFQHEGGRPEMDNFLIKATPRERELAGFPPIGDKYWDKLTVDAVEARYPGMDMTPYRDAL
ncbi:MAG: phytanoyl-CoA dioxygenase family protein [Mycobacterium sp.]|nr:phytanoyl-CoA dioxygenase family protein [Mycobacterium sp.]